MRLATGTASQTAEAEERPMGAVRTETEERRYLLLTMQGGPDAFAALVAARRARLLLLLVAAIGDRHEAEDGLQEVQWRAFTRLGTPRTAAAFDGWLRTVVLNEARERLRKAMTRGQREGLPAGDLADIGRLAEEGKAGVGAAADLPVLGLGRHPCALSGR